MRCLAVLALLVVISPGPDSRLWAQTTQAQLEKLRVEMATLQQKLDEELKARDQAMAELAHAQREKNLTQQRMDQTHRAQSELTRELQDLRQQSETLAEQSAISLSALTELLIKGYPVGEQSALKLLLNQHSPAQAARALAYHRRLSTHTLRALDQLGEHLAALNQTQIKLEAQAAELDALELRQAQDASQLETLIKESHAALSTINSRIETDETKLEQLKADQARLQEILDAAQALVPQPPLDEDPPSLLALKGALPMPVMGTLAQRFGQAREGDIAWRGWLIETAPAATVHAIGAGRVVYADWLRGYGLLIIVDHQDELMSLYAHNERLFFNVGDWVRAGDVLGIVSPSSLAPLQSRPGMYFELRQNGTPTNPAQWIDLDRRPKS